MRKFVFLLFLLAIPASFFTFLKFFGTNNFEVPYLFEKGIPGCPDASVPHLVSDITTNGESEDQTNSNLHKDFVVYGVFDVARPDQVKKMITELVRIQDAFYEVKAPYFILFIKGTPDQQGAIGSLCEEMGLSLKGSSIEYVEYNRLYDFLRCEIALIDESSEALTNLVLVDPDRRIRGIYNSMETDKTDQLILELKILKQQS